jgi:hypothetical protein
MGRGEGDHSKQLITLINDNNKRLSLYQQKLQQILNLNFIVGVSMSTGLNREVKKPKLKSLI